MSMAVVTVRDNDMFYSYEIIAAQDRTFEVHISTGSFFKGTCWAKRIETLAQAWQELNGAIAEYEEWDTSPVPRGTFQQPKE